MSLRRSTDIAIGPRSEWRAQIVLATADDLGVEAMMRRTGNRKTCVWRWQKRFIREGVAGLLRGKTRPSRIKKRLPQETVAQVVALTQKPVPGETTHWPSASMTKANGISQSAVLGIWRAHSLQPHRTRIFKLSRDPAFVEKLNDIVGFYVDPTVHAIVLLIDEKSQIQALDRI